MAASTVRLAQVTSIGHTWACSPLLSSTRYDHPTQIATTESNRSYLYDSTVLPSQQITRVSIIAERNNDDSSAKEVYKFVSRQLRSVIQGDVPAEESPPTVALHCQHLVQVGRELLIPVAELIPSQSERVHSLSLPSTRYFVEHGRRAMVAATVSASHSNIPSRLHPYIFPIFNPASVDFLIFWEIPSQGRSGHCLVSGLRLGATHAPLREIIEEAESAKTKRSMYAETRREHAGMLEAIRDSEWNTEMDPMVIVSHDGQQVQHDFFSGSVTQVIVSHFVADQLLDRPCQVPVSFTLRNISLTNPVRYTFKLAAVPVASASHP